LAISLAYNFAVFGSPAARFVLVACSVATGMGPGFFFAFSPGTLRSGEGDRIRSNRASRGRRMAAALAAAAAAAVEAAAWTRMAVTLNPLLFGVSLRF
jgi:hypothetical protein